MEPLEQRRWTDMSLAEAHGHSVLPVRGRTCPACGDYFTTTRSNCYYCSDDCRSWATRVRPDVRAEE